MATGFGNWQAEINKIWKDIDSNTVKEFQKLSTLTQKLSFVIKKDFLKNIPWLTVYFESCHKYHRKSTQKASSHRQNGNEHFRKKLYKKAVEEYTQAVLQALPLGSSDTELALAYANRSAALFHIKKYKECIADIKQALEAGYPEDAVYKLYMRRGQCWFYLGHPQTAEIDLLKAKELSEISKDLDLKRKESLTKEIKSILQRIEDTRLSGKLEPAVNMNDSDTTDVPKVSYNRNTVITQATSAVKMEYTDTQGRFIVATEDIRAGDTLFVERPYAAVLLPDQYTGYCHHCYGRLETGIPCRDCCTVLYCSNECRQEAWSTYHHIECCYLDLLHSVGIAHLSLRVVLTSGLDYLLDFRKTKFKPLDIDKRTGRLIADGKYENNYLAVYDLLPHSDDMVMEDLFQYTLTAVLLLQILQHSAWLKQIKNDDLSDTKETSRSQSVRKGLESLDLQDTDDGNSVEQYVGALLLRHILQLVCNAHAITELQATEVDDNSLVESKSQVRIATAIYPTASLMNHSCDPSIISSFQKNVLVVKAVRDIPKNDEVFNCYGPHCKRMSRSERQQVLQDQYFFTCICDPCQNQNTDSTCFNSVRCIKCDEPTEERGDVFICSKCGAKMIGADYKQKEMKAKDLFVKGLLGLQNNDIQGAIQSLLGCYKIRKHVLYKYHKDLSETQDCLARCYAIIGDFKNAARYLHESIQTVEVTYGPTSIELANELQKYAEVLCNNKEVDEALSVIEKALSIFTIHYSEGHGSIKELQELKVCLLQVKENT